MKTADRYEVHTQDIIIETADNLGDCYEYAVRMGLPESSVWVRFTDGTAQPVG
jgi:hypothetical protein